MDRIEQLTIQNVFTRCSAESEQSAMILRRVAQTIIKASERGEEPQSEALFCHCKSVFKAFSSLLEKYFSSMRETI